MGGALSLPNPQKVAFGENDRRARVGRRMKSANAVFRPQPDSMPNFRFADHPDHCRSGPLESPHQSVEPGCGFVEAFEHVDLAVLADKRDGESVAVRMKADAPGQD